MVPLDSYVLTCTAYDTATSTCTTQVWAPPHSVMPALPTLAQAVDLGGLIFAGLLGIRLMQMFLSPPRELDE